MELTIRWTVLALALSISLAGCGGGSGEEGTGGANGKSSSKASLDSPKAAFEAGKKAIDAKDMGAFYDVLDPDSKEKFAAMMPMMGGFAAMGDEAATKEFEALLEKHGIKKPEGGEEGMSEEKMKAAIAGVKDKRALVVDVSAFAQKRSSEMSDRPWVEVKDIVEEGDKAKGTLVSKKKSGDNKEEPIEFKKVGGSWYIVLPDK